jgi:hypothetical protein
MAAPPKVTIKNLSGKFVLVYETALCAFYSAELKSLQNKTLSDDIDALLTLQGLSWLTRLAISLATVVVGPSLLKYAPSTYRCSRASRQDSADSSVTCSLP